ncbi:hypothetical protein CVT24_001469 [Panaeolus cyanescens]|uniref:Nephrocystin 3-like N-terminal domain-containing protein n=1 Tax=Panaeolus cyanescens TaxID=181874 RepID=A0A409VTP2_9AGAR|nr:hypothetical protein CVT24_001469 [Panaeolus cyanescens]
MSQMDLQRQATPSHPPPQILRQNVMINNPQISTYNYTSQVQTTTAQALEVLYNRSAPAAFHNSLERCNPPRCHPSTRRSIRQKLLTFTKDLSAQTVWLHGPAGGGKSAIVQTVSEELHRTNHLAGAFFFSYIVRDDHRHHEKRLITTLAFQLAQNVPAVQPYIQRAIERNLAVFDLSLEEQLDLLILQPFRQLRSESTNHQALLDELPRTFVVDGLDECGDLEAQERVLDVLHRMVYNRDAHPFLVIITSCPETHIKAWFDKHAVLPYMNAINLRQSFESSNSDIKVFFEDEFADIVQFHPFKGHLPADWPHRELITELVRRSSGQFMYATAVTKFIRNPKGVPSERLEYILNAVTAKPSSRNPLVDLDSRHTVILQKAEYLEEFKNLMGVWLTLGGKGPAWLLPSAQMTYIAKLFSFTAPVDVIAAEFSSILQLEITDIPHEYDFETESHFQLCNISLLEFITDPRRAPENVYLDLHSWMSATRRKCHDSLLQEWKSGAELTQPLWDDMIDPFLNYTDWLWKLYSNTIYTRDSALPRDGDRQILGYYEDPVTKHLDVSGLEDELYNPDYNMSAPDFFYPTIFSPQNYTAAVLHYIDIYELNSYSSGPHYTQLVIPIYLLKRCTLSEEIAHKILQSRGVAENLVNRRVRLPSILESNYRTYIKARFNFQSSFVYVSRSADL